MGIVLDTMHNLFSNFLFIASYQLTIEQYDIISIAMTRTGFKKMRATNLQMMYLNKH